MLDDFGRPMFGEGFAQETGEPMGTNRAIL